jgi:putative FmdB family regulatory protein
MPLYEYRCSKCGNVFEVIQKFADAPLTEHPECGGAVERLLSTSALQFKGSGWYVNDYAKKSSSGKGEGKSESRSEGKSESHSEGKSEGKSESKSDGKSDSKSADSGSKSESKPAASSKSSE